MMRSKMNDVRFDRKGSEPHARTRVRWWRGRFAGQGWQVERPTAWCTVVTIALMAWCSPWTHASPSAPRVPAYKTTELLLDAEVRDGQTRYPAFPALLPLGQNRVLVTYKDGRGHANDPGAEIGTFELDLVTGMRRQGPRMTPPEPLLFQCAEPVRLADGRVALFIDTQRIGPEPRHYRAPMRWAWSSDGGKTFSAPAIFPEVDGVGYGYPQEGLTVGNTTYIMIMSFGYLAGGRWSMDILRTDDAGANWTRVRNLAQELGLPGFAEGTLLQQGDGFLVASRSYDQRTRLHELDREFKLRRQVELTGNSPWINSYVGRPRLFRYEGQTYLIGRNWTQPHAISAGRTADNPLGFPRAQQLCLFRLDPATLLPEACWILDNAEGAPVSDGYYAVVHTTGPATERRLHVLTYKGVGGVAPQLLRLEYRWSDFAE